MKFAVTKTSFHDDSKIEYIELSTLEEFLFWVYKQDDRVIVSTNCATDCAASLEIYDDWKE